ncbi:MAG: hypothetical protein P1V97_27410, partial [Planctomycetota bacterium]|nr:hypothetical protein [Planctomycetota bacterium]
MSDPRDLEALKEAHVRGWISREQGRFCFSQSQAQQRSPLELAVECSYLTTSQVHQLRPPSQVASQVSQAKSRGPQVGQV